MQLLSEQIESYISSSSWIRRMFETGIELKAKYGNDKVYDFSLGNPDLPPPAEVAAALKRVADGLDRSFALGYMPNAGYPQVREVLAARLAKEQKVDLKTENLVLTCGAAGGLNAFFRAVLDPGDEVLCPSPYFVEYGFYAGNHGGQLRPIKSNPMDFRLDLDAIDHAISPKTRVVLINSPNNPTGQVYTKKELETLVAILRKHGQANNRPLYLVSDEPYRFLTYDDIDVPAVLPLYEYSVVIGSFSKSLSLAGERVGYVAVNPQMPDGAQLLNGLVLTNRILGFVNAPAIGQMLLGEALGHEIDVNIYDQRRLAMARVLREAGIEFAMPKGAFYFFPRIPVGEDDTEFVRLLMEERVLAVPGSGFGFPGYFRLAFCTDQTVIEHSAKAFKTAVAKARA